MTSFDSNSAEYWEDRYFASEAENARLHRIIADMTLDLLIESGRFDEDSAALELARTVKISEANFHGMQQFRHLYFRHSNMSEVGEKTIKRQRKIIADLEKRLGLDDEL